MLEQYIQNLIINNIFSCEMILNIYLVAKSVRKTCLLEYANIKNQYNIQDFFKKILKIIDDINSFHYEKLTIYEENINYPRLLICKLNNYNEIFIKLKTCYYLDYEYQLGSLLGMLYPGNDFYNFHKPRITGRIFINNIYLYAETFIVENYEMDYCCLENHLLEKIEKFNIVLKELNLIAEYNISYDDGLDYRIKKMNENNHKYVQKNIHDYLNDIYNDHAYSKEQLKLIHSFVKSQI
jgi:hypothetical protein